MEERKPIAISVAGSKNIFVVCDDGTVWLNFGTGWTQQGKAVPGTKADERRSTDAIQMTPPEDEE